MVFFVQHADESRFILEEFTDFVSRLPGVSRVKESGQTPRCVECEFLSSGNEFAQIRLFTNLISVDGAEDAVLEFAVTCQANYWQDLVFGNTEAHCEIDLRIVNSPAELRDLLKEKWS